MLWSSRKLTGRVQYKAQNEAPWYSKHKYSHQIQFLYDCANNYEIG